MLPIKSISGIKPPLGRLCGGTSIITTPIFRDIDILTSGQMSNLVKFIHYNNLERLL